MCAFVSSSSFASAADTAELLEFQKTSATNAFAGKVAVASTLVGEGRDAALRKLLPTLCGARCADVVVGNEGEATQATSPSGILTVRGDGAVARFESVRLNAIAAVPYEKRLTDATVLAAGLKFVRESLGAAITLAPGEAIVPLYVSHLMRGIQNRSSRSVLTTVTGSSVLLARTINGVPVFGEGSKIVVSLANDGSVVGYEYDWPTYSVQAAKSYNLFAMAELRTRLASALTPFAPSLLGLGAWVPPRTIDWTPFVQTLRPTPLLPGVTLDALSCGYFDLGSARRSAGAKLLPACTAEVTFTNARARTDSAREFLIPASIDALFDRDWVAELAGRALPDLSRKGTRAGR